MLAATPLVAPSLLACDFARLGEEIRAVEQSGARVLHLDIMDGHFVPNLSFGIPVVEAVRRSTGLPLDVHLMIADPEQYVGAFVAAGANLLTVHIEVVPQPDELLKRIRDLGCLAGLSLNPPTPIETIEPFLPCCDIVLVMSVMPGFGGQDFDPAALKKLRRLRELSDGQLLLSVDGGVNRQTLGACAAAGANQFVMGTALFSQNDYRGFIQEMVGLAEAHPFVKES
ncbi:MAG: ribulose-phosphate 3-epimerase [Planctomycetota bacterium]